MSVDRCPHPSPRGAQVPELPEEKLEDSAASRSGRSSSPGGAGGGRGVGEGWAAPSPCLANPHSLHLYSLLGYQPTQVVAAARRRAQALYPHQWTQPRPVGRSARPADWWLRPAAARSYECPPAPPATQALSPNSSRVLGSRKDLLLPERRHPRFPELPRLTRTWAQ